MVLLPPCASAKKHTHAAHLILIVELISPNARRNSNKLPRLPVDRLRKADGFSPRLHAGCKPRPGWAEQLAVHVKLARWEHLSRKASPVGICVWAACLSSNLTQSASFQCRVRQFNAECINTMRTTQRRVRCLILVRPGISQQSCAGTLSLT